MSTQIHLVIGATATGKSARALELARTRDGVIINADSQQLYRELRILTARPSAEEEALAPHRLYGCMSADEGSSVAKWLRLACMEIDWARSNGKTPIVVGGTGLYIKALMEGIADIPEIDAAIRTQAENDMHAMGKPAFFERLMAIDPISAEKIGPHNTQRLIRAYAVWLGTAKPLSFWHAKGCTPPYPRDAFEIHHIELPRKELYKRCDARFDMMLKAGALEEVQALGNPIPEVLQKTIGVRELAAYLAREMTLEEAATKAKQLTRNYAKRQVTWFKNQLPAQAHNLTYE